MIMTSSGIAIVVASLFILNTCRPRATGKSAVMQIRWVEATLPLILTCAFALGVSLAIGGIVGH